MEVTFFMAAHEVLCFGFVARPVLIMHWCFGFCWASLAQHQGFIFHHSVSWEGTQLGELAGTDQRAIQDHAQQQKLRGGWAEVCYWEVMIVFAWLVPPALLRPLFSCILAQEFSHFCCSHSLPHPTVGREGASSLAAGQGQPWKTAESWLFYFYFVNYN